jgi:hypothetical protein
MSSLISPDVAIKESDQTNVVPAVSSTVGAYAGHFNWGPVDELVTVGSEKDLAKIFGSPAGNRNSRSFLTAGSFLKYSNALRVNRAVHSSARNAANENPVLIKNKDNFDAISTSLDCVFVARYPGDLGNSIRVSIAYVSTTPDSNYLSWPYRSLFSSAPNKSVAATNAGCTSNDEIHVAIIDELGLITGQRGTVLETWEGLSLGSSAKNENGSSIYYVDVINNNSSYVYVTSLQSIFPEADTAITEDSDFSVDETQVVEMSSLILPVNQTVETSVTIGDADPVVTTTVTPLDIKVLSGYEGLIGNNTKFTFRHRAVGDVTAKAAHGYFHYVSATNGDTVEVDGVTFTKAAAFDEDENEFADIDDLASLIDGLDDVMAEVIGNYVIITATSAGTAGNAIEISVGSSNVGTITASGPTLTGGSAANSNKLLEVFIDDTDALNGFVTYDITVGVSTVTVGPTTTNVTGVTLAELIKEIDYQLVALGNSDVPLLLFTLNDENIVGNENEALAAINVESLLPYSLTQTTVKVVPFTGGGSVSFSADSLVQNYSLQGGANGSQIPGNVVSALDIFADRDLVQVDFIYTEVFDEGQSAVDAKVIEIANGRADVLSAISAPITITSLTSDSAKKAAVIAKFDALPSTSFATFGSTPVYTYDKYNDTNVWIPEAGHILGLCANADFLAEPWFSPAGLNRGQLKGVIKIAYNPNKTDRDDLYNKRINPIITIPGEGPVLYGDKTALMKPSAFDRINVRRLFNVIQRQIATFAKYQLFQFNDEFTRVAFKNAIDPFLRDVQGRRGVTDFRVVCDETNNTGEVIDRNEFVGEIYVKPTRSINYITLNFIATRTGIDFREIVGS